MKKIITKKEYLVLAGLHALAKKHNGIIETLVQSVAEVIGEDESEKYGHAGDAMYGCNDYDVDSFLKKLDIEVKK